MANTLFISKKGSPRKRIVMDGNFSLKRKANKKIVEYREGIFAPTKEEIEIWGTEEEVERFAKSNDSEAKEEAVSYYFLYIHKI